MKNFYYSLIIFAISFYITAQTTPTGNSTEVGVTEGQLSVSLTGAATYSIPIAVPPGINGVVPQISLVYNSQGGNGMAGYGWNISGVSSITRIPRTKFHDGVVGGVNLDSNDRFALDGQRLILKSGASGVVGAIYETENFSNLKIEVFNGATQFYFKVFYPDGSIAVYDAEGTGSNLNYLIRSWTNAQSATITYSYIYDGNTSYVDEIQYGHITGGSPINKIKFNYITRTRPEQSYVKGISFNLSKILSSINVYGNAIGFKSYYLTPEGTSLGYTRLKSIKEYSFDGKSLNPTVFKYDTTTNSELFKVNPNKPQLGLTNLNGINAGTEVADFDGDGKNDIIVYAKTGPDAYNKYWLFNDIYGSTLDIGSDHSIGNFTDIFTTSYLKGDATNGFKLSPSQGWTIVKNNGDNYTFDTYALMPVAPSSGYIYYPFLQYTTTVAFPTRSIIEECNSPVVKKIFPKKILSGDFNGDGLTDAIAIDNPLYHDSCDLFGDRKYQVNSQSVYFIDLKKGVNNLSTPIGDINELATPDTKIETIDYNSDGKSDFLILTEGRVTVYTLGADNTLLVLTTYTDAGLQANKPCLWGDYNGDGKTDFAIPQAVGQDNWCFYYAKGNSSSGFNKIQKAIGLNYYENTSTETYIDGHWDQRSVEIHEHSYIANDLNGDGKTDILKQYNHSFDHINYYRTSYGQTVFNGSDYTGQGRPINTSLKLLENSSATENTITFSSSSEKYMSGLIHSYPIPIFTNHTKPNLNLEYSLLTNNTIYTFNSTKDNRIDTRLASVTTGNGVTESITYKPLIYDINEEYVSVYTSVLDKSAYPNADIGVAPGLQVVAMLEKQSASVYKKQLFAYAGATSNLEGLGYLGFRASMRTNWFEDDNQIISSISKFDPNLRGANIENYTYLGLATPEMVANTAVPNVPRKSAITVNNTRTTTETLLARNSITFLQGATISPTTGNTFVAKITPDYDANGFAETNTSPPTNLISKSLSFYESTLSPTKVFKLQNVQSNNYNILDNTSSESDIVYDVNSNPTESITKVRSGGVSQQTTTSAMVYESVSSPYMVGRLKSKTQTVATSGDSMNSKETYQYGSGSESNLLKIIQKWGNNTSAITETNVYDSFGNITQKTVSASGIADRKTIFAYDLTNRFVKESTDIEGFKTKFDYYPNGTLMSEKKQTESGLDNWTNALETGYTYDSWFRKKTVTDYLGKTYTYAYTRQNEKSKITLTSDTDGSYSEELYDDLGRKIRSGVKDIQGNISYKDYKYDIYDRNDSISEPNTGNPLWNTTTYDVYGRPKTVKDFKGKTLSMKYDKLTTDVIDSSTGQTKTTVKNAIGNVVSMKDSPIGGTINYSYFANGNLKESNYNGNKITMTQDGWGRKTSLTDPSAGTYTYEYNALGEITKETTPNGTTTYKLYDTGKLDTKTTTGIKTDNKTVYTYDPISELLQKTEYIDNEDTGKTITTEYTYDPQKRLKTTTEKNDYGAEFIKIFDYDGWGRIYKETNIAKLNEKESKTVTQNEYKNDFLYKIYEIKNDQITKTLWETSEVNARGQLIKAFLGNGILIDNKYDDKGYVTDMKHTLGTTNTMVLGNVFNATRGNLDSRTNNLFGNVTENFRYDSQDRLYEYPNASGAQETQFYEDDGRIKSNGLGTYSYANAAKKYQNTSIKPTDEALPYYEAKSKQTVSYNTFKSPVEIVEGEVEKISFVYNDNNDRSVMFYGGIDLKHTRTYAKHYSADGSMEIKQNTVTGAIEFVTYIGGDGYSAPVVFKKTFDGGGNTQEQTLYLHRDYQGSILAITNEAGAVVEKRQFDAWGAVLKVQDGAGNALNALTILDRGYTGHEHLQSVGLIHMNGRLYDPKLHRFLQPDNYVQDPSNTQNYNRYGYVLNNPLKYTDPSGEAYGDGLDCIGCGNGGINIGNTNIQPGTNGVDTEGAKRFWKDVKQTWGKIRHSWNTSNTKEMLNDVGNFIGNNASSLMGDLFGGDNRNAPTFQVGNVEQAQFQRQQKIDNFISNNPQMFDATYIENQQLGIYTTYDNRIEALASYFQIIGPEVPTSILRGVSSLFGKATELIKNGGKTFAQYRSAYWAGKSKPVLEPLINRETGQIWKQYMELHHRFIPQRWEWAPNWLKNNRFNLQELNSLEHAMADPYRARFAPTWVKEQYNLIWK